MLREARGKNRSENHQQSLGEGEPWTGLEQLRVRTSSMIMPARSCCSRLERATLKPCLNVEREMFWTFRQEYPCVASSEKLPSMAETPQSPQTDQHLQKRGGCG